MEHSVECGPVQPPPLDKKQQTALPPRAKALVIHTLSSVDPKQPCPEAVDGIDEIPLDEGRPDRTVQLGQEMESATRRSLVNLL